MKKSEDRIWDVLIEDALQEQPLEQAPPGDHTRRLLTPVGPLGIDRGRSMRRGGRRSWIPATVAIAALVLVAAILYGGAVWLPELSDANKTTPDQPQAAEETNQSPPRERRLSPNNLPAEEPNDEPEPQPEEKPQPDDLPSPDTEPQPEPAKPDDQGEQPAPEPEPEPVKPDDIVDKPKNPEETAPTPTPESGPTIRLLSADSRARLEFAVGGKTAQDREYAAAGERTEFPNGCWLAARKPVDLLVGGVLLRLEGELHMSISGSSLELLLEDDDLFVDNRGAALGVTMTVRTHTIGLASGATLVEIGAGGVEVSVFDGEVLFDSDTIPAGKRAVLKKRGLTGLQDSRDGMASAPFLKGLADRVVYHENFDADPDGRLREGKLADGVISGGTVFWGFPTNIAYEPGLVIRLRVRLRQAAQGTLTLFCEERNDNYSIELKDLKQGEWYVLEVRVDDLLERTKHEGHPQVGESFMNVSLQPEGENARVELDWVELIRAVK